MKNNGASLFNIVTQGSVESAVLVFRTDLHHEQRVEMIAADLDTHEKIFSWSVDHEDIDNVLRIETSGELHEKEIVVILESHQFICQPLPD